MKYAAIAILALGVAICAALGARLSPSLYDQTVVEGQTVVLGERVDEAHTAYCEARAEAELAVADGCPEPEGTEPAADEAAEAEEGTDAEATDADAEAQAAEDAPGDEEAEEAEEAAEAPDADAILATLTQELAAERQAAEPLPDDLNALRDAWYEARATVLPATALSQAAGVIGPGERMKGWLADSGAFFGVGLLLVVAGSVLGRRAAKLEASDESKAGPGGPVDVPGFLADAAARTAALAEEFAGAGTPDAAGWEHYKRGVTAILVERIEPLTESGPRIQARYGMAAFAAVFSPLSGGERRLNRAWSAMTDHHAPEALDSLRQAAEQLQAASAELASHRAG